METAERVHPYKWAQENLSAKRAEAFWFHYRQLERAKLSAEWQTESTKCDEIRRAFLKANREQTEAIYQASEVTADAIEETIRNLQKQVQEIRQTARERVEKIQSEVYNLDEYKEQDNKAREMWRRDDAEFQPKVQALMDKYLKAQQEVGLKA